LEKKTCIFVEFLLLTQVFQSTQWESLWILQIMRFNFFIC
jgi:hypothetical protein